MCLLTPPKKSRSNAASTLRRLATLAKGVSVLGDGYRSVGTHDDRCTRDEHAVPTIPFSARCDSGKLATDIAAWRSNTMAEQASSFRDFGILPVGLKPPAERVRCFLSTGRVVGQWIGTGLVASVGVLLAVVFMIFFPPPLSLLGAAAAVVAFAAFVHLATRNDYRWIELDGNTLRARRLYTGRIIERPIDEIDCLGTMVYQVGGDTTEVLEALLGRVKGVEVRFRNQRTPLRILRADPAMTNAAELIEALLYRMRQQRDLDTEIVNWIGKPLVRRVWWKGETPGKPPGKVLKLVLALVIFFALALAGVCGAVWLRVQDQFEGGRLPPHEIDLRTLIEHGPGANRHVIVTGFDPGGHAVMSEGKLWKEVWVVLFPAGARPEERREIKVVASSKSVSGEPMLRQWFALGRITGICSAEPRTRWGTSLGSLLSQANGGSTLTAAWSIDEVRERPSAEEVTRTWAGAVGGFAAVLILAAIVFLIAR
jgi:hypothetical protein